MAFKTFPSSCNCPLYVVSILSSQKESPYPMSHYFPYIEFKNKKQAFHRQAWKGGHSKRGNSQSPWDIRSLGMMQMCVLQRWRSDGTRQEGKAGGEGKIMKPPRSVKQLQSVKGGKEESVVPGHSWVIFKSGEILSTLRWMQFELGFLNLGTTDILGPDDSLLSFAL